MQQNPLYSLRVQFKLSTKEKLHIFISNIKSRFNQGYLWSHFRNAVLTALIRHSESKITAARSTNVSMCMWFVCVFRAPCTDMLLNSCVEKWFCEVWKSICVMMYNQHPTVVSHFPLITEVWILLNNIKKWHKITAVQCTF